MTADNERLDLRITEAAIDSGYWAKRYNEDVMALRKELRAVYENLTTTQTRCTELLEELRAAKDWP
jgi:hypothetical protein